MIDLHASSFLRYYSSYISEKKAADKKVGRKKMQLAFSSFLYFFKLLKDKSELERFFYKLESDGLQLSKTDVLSSKEEDVLLQLHVI